MDEAEVRSGWASRGMKVWGIDVSPVAINFARELAELSGLSELCRFDVHDSDEGLPQGEADDLVFCCLFRNSQLDQPMVDRLAPGGLLAVACLSEVDASSGEFRIPRGELREAFGGLKVLDEGEADGMARILTRKKA